MFSKLGQKVAEWGIGSFVAVFLAAVFLAIPGWFMNFQNLWQYPVGSKEFILSLVGVFFEPLGGLLGWIW